MIHSRFFVILYSQRHNSKNVIQDFASFSASPSWWASSSAWRSSSSLCASSAAAVVHSAWSQRREAEGKSSEWVSSFKPLRNLNYYVVLNFFCLIEKDEVDVQLLEWVGSFSLKRSAEFSLPTGFSVEFAILYADCLPCLVEKFK